MKGVDQMRNGAERMLQSIKWRMENGQKEKRRKEMRELPKIFREKENWKDRQCCTNIERLRTSADRSGLQS